VSAEAITQDPARTAGSSPAPSATVTFRGAGRWRGRNAPSGLPAAPGAPGGRSHRLPAFVGGERPCAADVIRRRRRRGRVCAPLGCNPGVRGAIAAGSRLLWRRPASPRPGRMCPTRSDSSVLALRYRDR